MMNQALTRKSANIIPYQIQMLFSGGGGGGGAATLPSKETQTAAMLLPLDKGEWRPQGYNAESSLPNSQNELDEDMDVPSHSRGSTSPPETPTTTANALDDLRPLDSLCRETRELLYVLFREQCGGKGAESHPKALDTLRRVGAEINEKHQLAFQGMLQKLSIQSEEDIQKLSEVPSMVFSDGKTNWGRIVTLISFGTFLAKHLKSIQLESCIRMVADNFTDYLMTQQRAWIVQNHGWDGCVNFFRVEDYEGGIRTVLMAFAGVAGLGVSLAYMIR